eukprot:CAMPEP_0114127622 /NCGR_PEP_ID=MMETSP0043_2-20121206/10483_1 /TAXON_ID=464988 /ORGANISM="Hemiselmis andersenii, Strain CCMP644" /LENGTH=128 /DNA_ID=CAMNT_0001220729 /DNA_START=344 /DNA_END=729 /DNA_ORIENTATION=+
MRTLALQAAPHAELVLDASSPAALEARLLRRLVCSNPVIVARVVSWHVGVRQHRVPRRPAPTGQHLNLHAAATVLPASSTLWLTIGSAGTTHFSVESDTHVVLLHSAGLLPSTNTLALSTALTLCPPD